MSVAVDTKPVVELNVANADSSDASKLVLSCNSVAKTFTAKSVIALGVSTSTITPASNFALGDVCTLSGNITTTGAGGSVVTPVSMSFGVVAPVAWWPPTFVSMTYMYLDLTKASAGAVVNATYPGQAQSGLLPPACKRIGDDCWKEAVRNGTVRFTNIKGVNANQPSRAVVYGFYKTVSTLTMPGKMVYCAKPFYADDGTLAFGGGSGDVEDRCSPDEGMYLVEKDLGVILQGKNSLTGVSACFYRSYSTLYDGWLTTEAACPK